jgi:hypothetical protein
VQQIAALFDTDEYTLRYFDEKWGVSALFKTLSLEGAYIVGALVLIGGFGWINFGATAGWRISALACCASNALPLPPR